MKETAEDINKGPFNAWLHKIPFILDRSESERHKSPIPPPVLPVTWRKHTLIRITIGSAETTFKKNKKYRWYVEGVCVCVGGDFSKDRDS